MDNFDEALATPRRMQREQRMRERLKFLADEDSCREECK
jgi:hypothetical protein